MRVDELSVVFARAVPSRDLTAVVLLDAMIVMLCMGM